MPNKRYLAGRRAEQLLKRTLEAQGAHVTRSAGSKGKWDLIAVNAGGYVQLIQVKSLKSGVSHNAVRKEFQAKKIIPGVGYIQVLCVRQAGEWHSYYPNFLEA